MILILESNNQLGTESISNTILLNLQTATESLTAVRNIFLESSGGCVLANDLEYCLQVLEQCRKCRLINGTGCQKSECKKG